MSPGRQSRALSSQQIERLDHVRRHHSFSLPQLKLAMEAPFTWRVLRRALEGKPIWILSADFIVDWLDRVNPAPQNGERNEAPAGTASLAARSELARKD
jgi:hypothetical protein